MPVSCQCSYMHSVQVEAHTHNTSISPKAELKVHVFLNVGHQRDCKVVTSGTSVKINVFFCQRVYDLYSFIAPQPNWRGYSLILWILRTAPLGSPWLSGTSTTSKDSQWCGVISAMVEKHNEWIKIVNPSEEKNIYFEVKWTRSELTAVYWKHLSQMPPGVCCCRWHKQVIRWLYYH